MSDEDADEAAIREQIAFYARFPLEAFEPIAHALGKSVRPQSLEAARDWLLPCFDFAFGGRGKSRGKKRTRDDQIKTLVKLRDAATTLLKSGLWRHLPLDVVEAASDRQFKATLERLADAAQAQIDMLSRPGRSGRPAKNAAFRELAQDLVRIYEHIAQKKAGKPYWLPDSRTYGGHFYRFAVAIWRCLHDCLPEVRGYLPETEGALAEELRNRWPKEDTSTG